MYVPVQLTIGPNFVIYFFSKFDKNDTIRIYIFGIEKAYCTLCYLIHKHQTTKLNIHFRLNEMIVMN